MTSDQSLTNKFLLPPFIDEVIHSVPNEIQDLFSRLDYIPNYFWTLPLSTKLFSTFIDDNLYIWTPQKLLYNTKIRKVYRHKAIYINDQLLFVSTDGELHSLKVTADYDISNPEVPVLKNSKILSLKKISEEEAIFITSNNYVYIFKNGQSEFLKTLNLSLFIPFDDNSLGALENVVFEIGRGFKITNSLYMSQFESISDIFRVKDDLYLVVGISRRNTVIATHLHLSSFNDDSDYKLCIHTLAVSYESIYYINNVIVLVGSYGISIIDINFNQLGCFSFGASDHLVSSQVINETIFIHLSKSGIHAFHPISSNTKVDDSNIFYTLYYNLFLYLNGKQITENFISYIKKCNKSHIANIEIQYFIKLQSIFDDLPFEHLRLIHNNLIKMFSSNSELKRIIPALNINSIYLNLLDKCSSDEFLYRYSTFSQLNLLLQHIDLANFDLLFDSFNDLTNKEKSKLMEFDITKLSDVLNRIAEICKDDNILIKILKCHLFLRKPESEILEIARSLIKTKIDELENLAIKFKRIDILYEIIFVTHDFRRAVRYSQQSNGEFVKPIYERFQNEKYIQRKLASLKGWESVDEKLQYKDGSFVKITEGPSISLSALSLLIEFVDDESSEIAHIKEELQIP